MTKYRHEHHEENGREEDTTYVYSRAEDRSFWARTSATIDKYKLIWWAVGAFVVSAGFGFRTPVQALGEIHAEIDTLQSQQQVGKRERTLLEQKIDALLRLECVKARKENRLDEVVLAGINCTN
jgi:hypothetical protein